MSAEHQAGGEGWGGAGRAGRPVQLSRQTNMSSAKRLLHSPSMSQAPELHVAPPFFLSTVLFLRPTRSEAPDSAKLKEPAAAAMLLRH